MKNSTVVIILVNCEENVRGKDNHRIVTTYSQDYSVILNRFGFGRIGLPVFLQNHLMVPRKWVCHICVRVLFAKVKHKDEGFLEGEDRVSRCRLRCGNGRLHNFGHRCCRTHEPLCLKVDSLECRFVLRGFQNR